MAFIRGLDGKLYEYSEYEERIKPYWKALGNKEISKWKRDKDS